MREELAERRMPADTADWIRRLIEEDSLGRSQEEIRGRVEGIERLLALKHRARVLDLGCGSGRQTIELAGKGYRVLGMDASSAALARARAAVRGQKLNVHFLGGDMRRIPYAEEFNAVINLQHPLGCYPEERDDLHCLQAIHRALKSNGKLLLDLVNREWLVCQLGPQALKGDASALDLETGRLDCRGLIPAAQARPAVLGDSLRVYSLTEIISLLGRAGLAFRKVWGDFNGGPYGIRSPRMIVLAEKCPAAHKAPKQDGLARALRIKGRPK